MKKKMKKTVIQLTELVIAGVLISAFTAYMVWTYVPRVEERIIENSLIFEELPDSTQYMWTIMDVSGHTNDVWHTEIEPEVDSGFVKFYTGRFADWVWLPVEHTRVYKQEYR